jgi:SAM-dependent methyltransferase
MNEWQLDEMAHAGSEHLDPEYVDTYDAKAGVNADAEVAELRELGLDASATLVDLGAGTGLLALAAARICRRVIAVDVSFPMIERMEDRATELGLTNLECVHGGFLTYEHRGSLADMVYSRNALHHLPDFWKGIALARVASILRSGGVFVLRDLVYSFELTEADAVIGAWLSRAPDQPAAGWTAAELATHVREEYSTYSWLLEPMLLRAGFDISEAEYSTSRTFARYVCIKR